MANNIIVAVVQQAAPASTGTQDFTSSSAFAGATPKAALFFANLGQSLDTPITDATLCIGATDGAQQWAAAINAVDGVGNSDTSKRFDSDLCVNIISGATGALTWAASGAGGSAGPIANGWRINWSTVQATGVLVTCVIFGGADMQADVGVHVISNTVDVASTPTTFSFTRSADTNPLLMFFGCNASEEAAGGTNVARLSWGAATWNGSAIVQRAIQFSSDNGSANQRVAGIFHTDRIGGLQTDNSVNSTWELELTSVTTTQFTTTPRTGAPTSSTDEIGFLAIDCGAGHHLQVGTGTTKTTAGTQAHALASGFGTPQAIIAGFTYHDASDAASVGVEPESLGIGAASNATGSLVEGSSNYAEDDASDPTNAASISENTILNLYHTGGDTKGYQANVDSFGADAFTLNYTTIDGTGRRFWYAAIEAKAAGGATLVIADAVHAHTAGNVVLTQAHALVVADAAHGHTADNVVLTQVHVLTIADALHAHAAENIVLEAAGTLVVQDALHSHVAENLDLTQVHALVIADAVHDHAADNVVLDVSVVLSIADAVHAHAAEGVTLGQSHLLAIADALHAHAADSLALIQQHALAIADALHAHAADNIVLSDESIVLVTDPSRRVLVLSDGRCAWVGVRRMH